MSGICQFESDILRRPVVTEKSHINTTLNKYTFVVQKEADKPLVKKAVESIFSVTVEKVNIINRKGKTKTFRGRKGKRSDTKIAVVTLAEGSTIDFEGGA